MSDVPRSALRRYGVAVLATIVALLVHKILGSAIVPSVYLTFYGAVLISAMYGGLGPGLLTTGLSAVAGWHFFLRPVAESGGFDLTSGWRALLFTAVSTLMTWLVDRRRLARDALEAAKEELEARVAERTAELEAANRKLEGELRERERVAAALQQSEENYRHISELTSDYAYRFRVEAGRVVFEWFAGAFSRITGYAPEEIRGVRDIQEIVHPDDRPILVERMARLLAGEPVTSEFRMRTKDGSYRWLQDYARPERDGADSPTVRVIGAARDITERKRAEDELRSSEERFAIAVAGSNDGVWDWNLIHNTAYLSSRWRAILGIAEEEELSTDPDVWVSRIHADDADRVATDLASHLEGQTPLFRCEYRMRHADGTYRWVLSRGLALRDAEGKAYRMAGSLTDVTPRRQAEDEARRRQAEVAHAQRLSTLGEMAAGLAHELNQPLAAIVSYARGCVRRLRSGEARPEDLVHPIEEVAKQALRAGAVLQRYRAFVRGGTLRREPVRINQLAREAADFVAASAAEQGVSVRLRLPANLPEVIVDGVQIEQVLLNLVRNAMESMQGCPRRELSILARAIEDGVEVAVEDAGAGIPPEVGERIFEAFFTTKEEGLGMGLSISRSIIEAHGGRLWSTPNPGGGTTFRFTLPLRPPHEEIAADVADRGGEPQAVPPTAVDVLSTAEFKTRN